jgi:hypothetical protein
MRRFSENQKSQTVILIVKQLKKTLNYSDTIVVRITINTVVRSAFDATNFRFYVVVFFLIVIADLFVPYFKSLLRPPPLPHLLNFKDSTMRYAHLKSLLLVSTACLFATPAAFAADDDLSADAQQPIVIAMNTPAQASAPYAAPAKAPAPAAGQNSFLDALTNGTPLLDVRYRYEDVNQDGLAHPNGFANTIRTRAGYETGVFDDFKAKVQVENLLPLSGNDHSNDTVNGLTKFPTIADPRQAIDLYEANVTWSGVPQSTLTFGREALALNNERWVGTTDWRQLGQTMDGLTAQNHSIRNVDLFYTYGFHENRVFGPGAGGTNVSYDMHTHLLNADYTGIPGVKVIGYGYLLNLSNMPTLSSQTYGTRVEVNRNVYDNTNVLFNGEYARQANYGNNPVAFGYNYYTVEPGAVVGPFTAKVGYESMGGDGNHALQAPLDTGHLFNGWAERFLTTPAGGLDNIHVATEYKSPDYNEWLNSTVLKAIWYDFNADNNGMHYGNEYDFWAGQTFYKHYTVGLEYAQYNADKLLTSSHKFVAQLQIKY